MPLEHRKLGRHAQAASLLPLILGAAASLALLTIWPFFAGTKDALRSTFALVPLIVGLLHFQATVAGRAGRIKLATSALLLLTLVALCRPLRDPAFDLVLVATFFFVLAVAIVRLLPGLRSLLGRRLPASPSQLFWLLPFTFYFAILPWSIERRPPDGDEPFYLLLTHSLAFDWDVDLANNYAQGDSRAFLDRRLEPQPGDPIGSDGALLSRHSALLPLVLMPGYLFAGRLGASLSIALMAALTAFFLLRLAARLMPEQPRGAFFAWMIFVFTPPWIFYSAQIWIEVPAALLVVLALDRSFALDERRWSTLLLFALPLALLPLLKIRLLLVALPIALLGFLRLRRGGGQRMPLLLGLGLVIAGLLIYNGLRYGNPFKMYGWGDVELIFSPPAHHARGLIGLFFDCAFGLFAVAPIWLLLLPALLKLERRHAWLLVGLTLPYTLALTPRIEWFGGWAPAFRYPLLFLPLLALALVPLLAERTPWLRASWTALATVTLALILAFLLVPGFSYNLADGTNHLIKLAGLRFELDFGRFFPSTVRPRVATGVWLAAALFWTLVVSIRRLAPRGLFLQRLALPLGCAVALVAPALTVAAARAVPSARIELEDYQVEKLGGRLFPEQWAVQRAAFRGGWVLAPYDAVRLPVIPGGSRVDLTLAGKAWGPGGTDLELWIGERRIAGVRFEEGEFQELSIPGVIWAAGDRLLIRCLTPSGIILDRVDFDWHE